MRLNHLDLCVPDVAAATSFFAKALDFTVLDLRGEDMAILMGEGGFVLVLSHAADAHYPPAFHIGFLQTSREAVRAAYARLVDAGADIAAPPVETPGSLVFFCRAPGGLPIEVSYRT